MPAKLSYSYVRSVFKEEGYKLLFRTYENNKTRMRVMCPKGHKFSMRFSNFRSGQRCPQCSNRTSRGEKEVYKYVVSLVDEDVVPNDRTQLVNPKKLEEGWS